MCEQNEQLDTVLTSSECLSVGKAKYQFAQHIMSPELFL